MEEKTIQEQLDEIQETLEGVKPENLHNPIAKHLNGIAWQVTLVAFGMSLWAVITHMVTRGIADRIIAIEHLLQVAK